MKNINLEKISSIVILIIGLCIFIIIPTLIFSSALWITVSKHDLDLSEDWQECLLKADNVESAKKLMSKCLWENIDFPSSKTIVTPSKNNFKILKKSFETPQYCKLSDTGCSVLFGKIGDASQLFLNNQYVGKYIEFKPHYVPTYAYAVQFPLPKITSKNSEIIIISEFSYPVSMNRLGALPVSVLQTKTAFNYAQILNAYTIGLPILSAVVVVFSGIMSVLVCWFLGVTSKRDKKLQWIIVLSTFSAFYFLSLSRIPREFFYSKYYSLFHFFIGNLSDIAILYLYINIWDLKNSLTKTALSFFQVLTFVFFILIGFVFFGFLSEEFVNVRPIHGVSTALLVLALFGIFRDLLRLKKSCIIIFYTSILILVKVVDTSVLNFTDNEFYTLRYFYQQILFVLIISAILTYARAAVRVVNEATLGRSISTLLHDLKSTTMTLQFLSIHKKTQNDEDELLNTALSRLNEMMREVLSINKLDQNIKARNLKCVVNEILRQVSREHQLIANQSGGVVNLNLSTSDQLGILIPPHHLYRIVANLVLNALEAKKGTQVLIQSEQSDGSLIIKVIDNAGGFKSDGVIKPGGTGIGLYSCRLLTESYNGTLQIINKPDVGSEVVLNLPLE